MWKRVITVLLGAAIIFTAAGCGEGEDTVLPSSREIIDGVTEAMKDIRSFRYEMDMTVDMSGDVDGESVDILMTTSSEARIDLLNERMWMDASINIVMTDEDDVSMDMEIYLIDAVAYMLMEAPDFDPLWVKSEAPNEILSQMNQVGSQIELLETAEEVKVTGSEKVGSYYCYVLQLNPDAEQLWEVARQQSALGGGATLPDVPEDIFKELFKKFSVKQWIAKDTYRLVKTEIQMNMNLSADVLEVETGDVLWDTTMTIYLSDYNKSVSIVLPRDAENAVEVPDAFD